MNSEPFTAEWFRENWALNQAGNKSATFVNSPMIQPWKRWMIMIWNNIWQTKISHRFTTCLVKPQKEFSIDQKAQLPVVKKRSRSHNSFTWWDSVVWFWSIAVSYVPTVAAVDRVNWSKNCVFLISSRRFALCNVNNMLSNWHVFCFVELSKLQPKAKPTKNQFNTMIRTGKEKYYSFIHIYIYNHITQSRDSYIKQ